jgi:hypothetical protein
MAGNDALIDRVRPSEIVSVYDQPFQDNPARSWTPRSARH